MAFLKGEDIALGIERETVRGTPETPSQWLPARVPSGIHLIAEKVPVRETKGTGMVSQGAVLVQTRAEGDLEFNVRNNSIGMILLSLLGKVTSAANGSGYNHTFELLPANPQFPTLTLGLAQVGQQDYEYKKCIATALEIRTPVDDLVNATASFVGVGEATHADYTPSYASTDYYFRHYDVTIKIASNVAGLAAASALGVKEFSINIVNNGRVNQNIGELTPSDVLAIMHEITGSLKIDYQDETYHDLFTTELYRAMSITMVRSDVTISSGVNPKLVITLPKVSFSALDMDRPIDDIVSQNVDFTAHYDDTLAYGIQAVLTNQLANYN